MVEQSLVKYSGEIVPGSDLRVGTTRVYECKQVHTCRTGTWNVRSMTKIGKLESLNPVSYTHLDVYKRQHVYPAGDAI